MRAVTPTELVHNVNIRNGIIAFPLIWYLLTQFNYIQFILIHI